MNAYELPTSLEIGGVGYSIRADFRVILDILIAMKDQELDEQSKAYVLLKIFYPDVERIPASHIEEAYRKAVEFIDCGQTDDGKKPKPTLIDWEQDAAMIVSAVNSVAKTEIRALPFVHWWTFYGWFMGIEESLLANVLHIRIKKSKHKKLEKHEQEFYNENRDLIDLKHNESAEERAQKDSILNFL